MQILVKINSLDNPLLDLIKDDPVRPEIPKEKRVSSNSEILILKKDENISAIVCVSYHDTVPSTIDELFASVSNPTVAVFYTIWSYVAGAGRDLIFEASKYIKEEKPSVQRFVTYSPKTELARKFHLKNGALIYRENIDSINYEYN
mgnify:CR=1 FL=1